MFQNCGGKNFSGAEDDGDKSATSASTSSAAGIPATVAGVAGSASQGSAGQVATSGNTITNKLGQTLAFVSNNGVPIGNVSVTSASSNLTAQLFNPTTGRLSTVTVIVDPKTGAFTGVRAAAASPYMCHDPNANACALYPNIVTGHSEPNCNSPIVFSGALTGSVNNLTDTAYTTFCANQNANLCQFSFAAGGSGASPNSNPSSCQAWCRQNANNNPGDAVTCIYGGQPISY